MPKGASKFSLEKTWHSAAPSTTTLNASGNFAVPYGRYDMKIYGYGGNPVPGNPGTPAIPGGNVSGYNYYFYYVYVPAAYNPGGVVFYTFGSYYEPVNMYTGTPTPGGGYYSGTSGPSYSPYSCPSPYSVTYYGPFGSGTSAQNYSCSPGPPVFTPAYSQQVDVPGNPNYNNYVPAVPATPPSPANPATLMGTTVPGGVTNYSSNATQVNYYSYPDYAAYPATISSGTGSQLVVVYR